MKASRCAAASPAGVEGTEWCEPGCWRASSLHARPAAQRDRARHAAIPCDPLQVATAGHRVARGGGPGRPRRRARCARRYELAAAVGVQRAAGALTDYDPLGSTGCACRRDRVGTADRYAKWGKAERRNRKVGPVKSTPIACSELRTRRDLESGESRSRLSTAFAPFVDRKALLAAFEREGLLFLWRSRQRDRDCCATEVEEGAGGAGRVGTRLWTVSPFARLARPSDRRRPLRRRISAARRMRGRSASRRRVAGPDARQTPDCRGQSPRGRLAAAQALRRGVPSPRAARDVTRTLRRHPAGLPAPGSAREVRAAGSWWVLGRAVRAAGKRLACCDDPPGSREQKSDRVSGATRSNLVGILTPDERFAITNHRILYARTACRSW